MMQLVKEFLGTFVFLYAVTKYGTPAAVALTLGLALYVLGGGHFNPAITFMKFLGGGVSQTAMLQMVLVQLLAAYVVVAYF